MYAGRISHVPLHFLKVYNPDSSISETQQHGEGVDVGGLVPPNFRDVITMDFSASPNGIAEPGAGLEPGETPAEVHVDPKKTESS